MITVLMSVYRGERADFLRLALESLVEQTEAPDEILLIKDGPIGPELDAVIEMYSDRLQLHTIALQQNQGLARALNVGLARAKHPWIMRFDTDDICRNDRVAKQRAMIRDGAADLFGSQIAEFDVDPGKAFRTRRIPILHDEILRFAKRRNPFNHMTVCYRKELALNCGGYPQIPFFEDYALWVRMIAAGAKCANLDEALVMARVGNGMIRRRGGLRYVLSEARLQSLMVGQEFKPLAAAILDGAARAMVFLLPVRLRAVIYRALLRENLK